MESDYYAVKLVLIGSKNTNYLMKNYSNNEAFGGNFFMSFFSCKTTANPLISTFVNKLLFNNHSPCYLCERVGHFLFYPAKSPE